MKNRFAYSSRDIIDRGITRTKQRLDQLRILRLVENKDYQKLVIGKKVFYLYSGAALRKLRTGRIKSGKAIYARDGRKHVK